MGTRSGTQLTDKKRTKIPTYQEIILRLQTFWMKQGCVILQPYNSEVGAGTLNPATFLRVLGPEPWRAAYVEPSKRPKDGRYGDNPNRVQQFLQYQVILKPPPTDVLRIYIKSLEYIGIDPAEHDIRLVEDDWEAPTLGASGLGWEVWLDGMEITQFTYFQQAGSLELDPVSAEITYGLLRICLYLQKVDSVMDIEWGDGVSWAEVNRQAEKEFSAFHFEAANTGLYFDLFQSFEDEAAKMLEANLVLEDARGGSRAARIRLRDQALAYIQYPGFAWRHQRHGTHRVHRADSRSGETGGVGLHGRP
jgi:glycyl-tRNA synthetase alpha chain